MLKKSIKWTLLALAGLLALGWYIDSTKTPEQRAAEAEQRRQEAKQEMASLPRYAARDLARAYNENTVAADARFKGKKFIVTGVVSDISTDLFGAPYLTLRGGVNQFMEPQFSFGRGSEDQLAAMRKGATVELICVGNGDVVKTPMNKDCIMP